MKNSSLKAPADELHFQNSRKDAKVNILTIVCLVFATLLIGGPTLLYPFARDQSEFACIGLSWLQGKAIYKEVFDMKPPLTHMVHALSLTLFGYNMVAIRIFDLLWQCFTAVTISFIVRAFYKDKVSGWAGMTGGLLYLWSFYWVGVWNTAQTDGFLNLPLSLCVLCAILAAQRSKPVLWGAAGVFLAIATLFKYPIIVFFPFLILFAMFQPKPQNDKRSIRIGLILAGYLLPLLLLFTFLLKEGSLKDFIDVHSYIWSHASVHGQAKSLSPFALLTDGLIVVSFLIAGGEAAIVPRPFKVPACFIIFWWLAAVFHILAQNKFFLYHYLPLFAPQSVMSAHVISYAWKNVLSNWKIRLGLGLFVIYAVLQYAGHRRTEYQLLGNFVSGKTNLREIYQDQKIGGSRIHFVVSDYIRGHTKPEDLIQIWGMEPAIYFLSSRQCATSFLSNYSLYSRFSGVHRLRSRFLQQIIDTAPEYFILIRDSPITFITGTTENSEQAFFSFKELQQYVAHHYETETTIENFVIFKRR